MKYTIKSFLFWIVLLTLCALLIESISGASYYLTNKEWPTHRKISEKREQIKNAYGANRKNTAQRDENNQIARGAYVLHPYLGYVPDPEIFSFRGRPINEHGFSGDRFSSYTDQNEYIVAVVGGSVAQRFVFESGDTLIALLKKIPSLKTKKFRLVNLAMETYKQPQQLLAVNYYLSLGGRIDLLINIDGFNEISQVAFLQNQGISYVYPYYWHELTEGVAPLELQALRGKNSLLNEMRYTLIDWFEYVDFSTTFNVIWFYSDLYLGSKINQIQVALGQYKSGQDLPCFRKGPFENLSRQMLMQRSAELWKSGSLQLHRVAKGGGFLYFNFLQPSQYMPETKTFHEIELHSAYVKDSTPDVDIPEGYPLLINLGKELTKNGVYFFDLTNIFKSVNDAMYADICCHLTTPGNNIMAENIAEHIKTVLQK
jgi:hypothetical protein